MKRCFLMFLLSVFTSGCISTQIIPKQNVLASIRTVSIVPIECPPLLLYPATAEDRSAVDALVDSAARPTGASAPSVTVPGASPSLPSASLVNAPSAIIRTAGSMVTIIGGIHVLIDVASAGKESGEPAVVGMDQSAQTWMPSVDFARTALAALQYAGGRDVRLVNGYVRLPIADRSMTWHMENWMGPIKKWYNADVSNVDYAAIDSYHSDSVLEVGVSSYQYYRESLILHVFVKLIDPHTKQVLGRAKKITIPPPDAGPLAPLLQKDAVGMKRLIVETGNRLITTCLTEIGLVSE
jgi:hypothetical protein